MLAKLDRAPLRKPIAIIVAAVATLAPTTALAQRRNLPPVGAGEMRTGLPVVNPRAFEADPDTGLQQTYAQFGSWHRAAGSPRILLFWNRMLSDDTTTRYRARERGSSVFTARRGLEVEAYERTTEQERTTGVTYADLHPDNAEVFESGFLSAFLRTGANVVDRNALMRKVSTRHASEDRSDQQFMEALALEERVEYLVEVLPDYHGDSDTGITFTVKITHLPSSSVKASFRTAALPAPGPERLLARPGGFERHRDNRNTPHRIAEHLAAEVMKGFF